MPANPENLRIVMAQLNLLVGDIAGNADKVIDAANTARDELNADLIVFPELTLTSYQPEDLLLRSEFINAAAKAFDRVLDQINGITAIIGHPLRDASGLRNSASVIRDGQVLAVYHKQLLPNYGVFDDKRYFVAGDQPCVIDIKGCKVGLSICEDVWEPVPSAQSAEAGAQILVNLNASPYHMEKSAQRLEVLRNRATETGLPVVYVNLVGGQDELVYDGHSMVVDKSGTVVASAPFYKEALIPVDFELGEEIKPVPLNVPAIPGFEEQIYGALVLGVKDYVNKNGFPGVVLGLSGGIDSALTLAIAVDALGADRVEAVLMSSRYTADMSVSDAEEEAITLGVAHRILPIEATFQAFLDTLEPVLAGTEPDTTEENLQARCRGMLLMAISNKTGKMVLTTANKSETAVGYSTLYGDMAGGFGPIKDVPKTVVYQLARWRNTVSPVIPERVITRPPSAELRPDQTDQDSLPDYEVLDPILHHYVELDESVDAIAAKGFDRETVERVARMVIRNEYKRRQAAPGVRITPRAFGRDRRYPITSGFKF